MRPGAAAATSLKNGTTCRSSTSIQKGSATWIASAPSSAAYAARHVAKNIVAAGLAKRCEVQVSYAIGVARPLSLMVETFGTNKISTEKIEKLLADHFDFRPGAIIQNLYLRRPIYQATAAYGHFGRHDIDAPWEKTDKVELLKKEAGL